jgi:hypothetical protein
MAWITEAVKKIGLGKLFSGGGAATGLVSSTVKTGAVVTGIGVTASTVENLTNDNPDNAGVISTGIMDPAGGLWERFSLWQGTAEKGQQQIQNEADLDKEAMSANIVLDQAAQQAEIELQQMAQTTLIQNEGFWFKVLNFVNEVTSVLGFEIPQIKNRLDEKRAQLEGAQDWEVERGNTILPRDNPNDAVTPGATNNLDTQANVNRTFNGEVSGPTTQPAGDIRQRLENNGFGAPAPVV